jgi:ribosome modulation factor
VTAKQTAVLTHDPRAWQAGFADGERGALHFHCPYPAASTESWSWSSGFVEGKAKRDGYEYSNPAPRAKL